MKWVMSENLKKPVNSWCETIDDDAMKQAVNLANHPIDEVIESEFDLVKPVKKLKSLGVIKG